MAIIAYILLFLLKILSVICRPIRWYYQLQKRKPLPPIQNELLFLPGVKLAEKIRRKEVTSTEVVKAYIKRIKAVNPIINAVVQERFDQALEEAKQIDELLSKNRYSEEDPLIKKPFLGVPFTVKESISVQGLSNRAGSLVYPRDNMNQDAKVVKSLKEAGAIPLLVSNTPELCTNWETSNKITGTTNNPYDNRRTCGGSSGGEAALLGSGASVIGLGSDVGGSLRIPPQFCGVWGHKPSPGVVSDEGHFPSCKNKDVWKNVFTVGPMARYAVDLPKLLHVISSEDAKKNLHLLDEVDLKKIRVFYMENDGGCVVTNPVDEDIVTGMRKFVQHLQEVRGVEAQPLEVPGLKNSHLALLSLLHIEGVTLVVKENQNSLLALLRYFFCISPATFLPILYAFGQPIIKTITPRSLMEGIEKELRVVKETILQALGEDGVLLYPSFPTPAHFHNEIYYRVFDTSYLGVFNALGLPSTSCVLGVKKNGLPIGFQVVTSPNRDRLSLRIARELEETLGGWTPPHL